MTFLPHLSNIDEVVPIIVLARGELIKRLIK